MSVHQSLFSQDKRQSLVQHDGGHTLQTIRSPSLDRSFELACTFEVLRFGDEERVGDEAGGKKDDAWIRFCHSGLRV